MASTTGSVPSRASLPSGEAARRSSASRNSGSSSSASAGNAASAPAAPAAAPRFCFQYSTSPVTAKPSAADTMRMVYTHV